MPNDIVTTAMSFIFEADKKLLREGLIEILRLHQTPEAGQPPIDIMNLGVQFGDTIWTHPDRPKQVHGGVKLKVVPCFPEHDIRAKNLLSDMQLLSKDTARAKKTLTQLVRGMNTDQDLRDSLPECLVNKLGLGHLERTREVAYRYATMEPRVHASIVKDCDMIEGYFNARALL